jgi:hypothetical protein
MTQSVLTNDEAVTGSKHFFHLFSLLLKGYVTNLRGTLVPVPISTHPNIQNVYHRKYMLNEISARQFLSFGV